MSDDDRIRVEMLVPRSALVTEVRAEIITQRNSLHAIGQQPRHFLETLRRDDFDVPIIPMGKLRGVEREPYLAWLRARAVVKHAPANDDAVPPAELDPIERAIRSVGGRIVR
ncbi:MAG TPA: hypothetical protein VK550_13565 [Polyangiaceae bacterium]|nr:hypothetical protein [Polyangiaceae bacterium]